MRSHRAGRGESIPTWPGPTWTNTAGRNGSGRTFGQKLWLAARLLVAVFLLLLGIASALYWRLSATVTAYPGAHFNTGKNAVWLEHAWSGNYHAPGEYAALASSLRRQQIGYVFAHVGPLNSDGTIPQTRAPYAGELVNELHTLDPGIKVLAWIGQVETSGGYPPNESVNLDNSSVRYQIAATSSHFVRDLGFDGVHYDIEPIINNNAHFLDLLTETRQELPAGAILSVVGQKWAPSARLTVALRALGKADAWWTSYYYAAVASHVDQIVPMIYDTSLPTADLYQVAVQQETRNILQAVRSARTPPQILIGLPTYTGNSFWFHSDAENMTTGLQGVTAGLNSNRDTRPFAGVAIYRYGLTTAADWSVYDRLWLGQG